ncbi:hypothetical protein HK103_000948 [Boothiomyces macroporosus]|uniref:C2H2-type domain-containing protein n=1 Tax=Boothiomyces macroporosus TaxID=261099 RepID=A0AAD5UME6_9FUNG|nr:hypothetical protein HK103_000948 [Boothiomyces macroporosus]
MTDRASIETFNCYACTTGFENEADLIAHVKEVGHNYCIDCRKEFNSPESLKEHQTTSKKHLKFAEKRQSRILNLSAETLADIDIVAQSKTTELSKEPAPELKKIDQVEKAVETSLSDGQDVAKEIVTVAETDLKTTESTVQVIQETKEAISVTVSESVTKVEEAVNSHIEKVDETKEKLAKAAAEKQDEAAIEVSNVVEAAENKIGDVVQSVNKDDIKSKIETVVQIPKDVQVLVSEKADNAKAKARLCNCTIL